jgi:hypothetical protein
MVSILRYVFNHPQGSVAEWKTMLPKQGGVGPLMNAWEDALDVTFAAKGRGDSKAQFRAALRTWAVALQARHAKIMGWDDLRHCVESLFEQDFIKPDWEVPDDRITEIA